ncbi:exonuclease domain-containing protein [Aeromicrobium sp. 179-A 4D2 NHS]|uniref:exonuclease domain-containing protein n=1 Tax=Aeromicrobium sp. 179-A 4D2 NHS TaxID=3142375 RepID=UPI0039A35BE7
MTLKFLVTDIEATGLDENLDGLLEIACIGVNRDLEELFRYRSLIKPTPAHWERLLANQFVYDMHKANGLIAELEAGMAADTLPAISTVANDLADLVLAHYDINDKPKLAGSGVSHYDSRFLNPGMPALMNLLEPAPRRASDIGYSRILFHDLTGIDLTSVNEDKTHRAMDDVECHLAEYRAFRDLFISAAADLRVGA